jgi:hypothetical protein
LSLVRSLAGAILAFMRFFPIVLAAAAAIVLLARSAFAQERSENELTRLETVARVSTTTETTFRALCDGARVAFDLGEPETNRSGEFAARGLALADRARKLVPDRAEGHYRYALCLGIYLREHPLSGIRRAGELATSGEEAARLDEKFDNGGPHRFLAVLYAEAPRFVGPGDHDKAREHLARLLEIAPDAQENRVAAVRVHIALGEDDEARAALKDVKPDRASDEHERRYLTDERARLQKKLDE